MVQTRGSGAMALMCKSHQTLILSKLISVSLCLLIYRTRTHVSRDWYEVLIMQTRHSEAYFYYVLSKYHFVVLAKKGLTQNVFYLRKKVSNKYHLAE